MMKDEALESLHASGLRNVIEWAVRVAVARAAQDYDDAAGHDQMVIGVLIFKYICDLIDRATGNGRYSLPGDSGNRGQDILRSGITEEAWRAMPKVPPGRIRRIDFRSSPGWAIDGIRVLLQSFKYGEVDRIQWSNRSETKQLVAAQSFKTQDTLFNDDDFGLEISAGIPGDDSFDGTTLIVAHSYDVSTARNELYIGQSKNPAFRGDSCWHWRQRLLDGTTIPEFMERNRTLRLPGDAASIQAEEIPVRLKRVATGRGTVASND